MKIQSTPLFKRKHNLFLFTIVLAFALTSFSGCTRSFSNHLNMEEADGWNNINEHVRALVDDGFQLTHLELSARTESSKLGHISLSTVSRETLLKNKSERKMQIKIKENITKNTLQRDTAHINSSYYKTEKYFDIPGTFKYIEQCKTMIPEGYSYTHLEKVVFRPDKETFTIVVTKDKNTTTSSKSVYRKKKIKYVKQYSYSRKVRRQVGTKTVEYYHYTMKFQMTPAGLIIL